MPPTIDAPPIIAPEKSARSPNGLYEFRDERWVELYTKKIEEMIGVLKSKGVPVLWVGLPAIRGPKGTSDMLFLDALYRDAAGKAGITYVDVWDGFVDEAGRFMQKGPDFEGQTRQLRSYDGVYFTKTGARKLAHYVEREITRLLAARSAPIALPTEPATPDANAVPGQPAPRPLAGPILPLVASSVGTDQLLGGPGTRPAAVDALAARTLVKGEPLAPPAGRADDFAWPRREIGREQAKGETPVATTAPDGTVSALPDRSSRCCRSSHRRRSRRSNSGRRRTARRRCAISSAALATTAAPDRATRRAAPAAPGAPRPPGNVGRSAAVPAGQHHAISISHSGASSLEPGVRDRRDPGPASAHPRRCNRASAECVVRCLAVIPPARRRAARRARHQQRQRKSDAAGDQQRAERIVLHRLRHRLLAAANGVAAVVIGVLGVVDGGIGGVARGILGLAVEILHRARGFARAARGLRLRIAGQIADGAFDLPAKSLAEPAIRSLSIAVTPVSGGCNRREQSDSRRSSGP